MDFIAKELQDYVNNHSAEEPELLAQLNRETHDKKMYPRMLSGHLQGRVLAMITHMIKPKVVLEIGTYTGYSAICMTEGLAENGKIITLEVNEEHEEICKRYFEKAGVANIIDLLIGNAVEIIPQLEDTLDMVFIDADKKNYSNYFNLVIEKVRPGGFIIADNVLWSGKVIERTPKTDPETQAILDFNRLVQENDQVENVLFPIRDGLMILRKKE